MSALMFATARHVEDEDLKRRIGETLLAFMGYASAGEATEDVTRRLLVTRDAKPADLTPLYRELGMEQQGYSIDREYGIGGFRRDG